MTRENKSQSLPSSHIESSGKVSLGRWCERERMTWGIKVYDDRVESESMCFKGCQRSSLSMPSVIRASRREEMATLTLTMIR